MVSYEDVNGALPKKWATASAEWHSPAKYALDSAKDLRDNGVKPLADNWRDEVGAAAAKKFAKLADELEVAYGILLSVHMVVDGMTTPPQTARSTLREACELAQRYGLDIGRRR
ncbi:hypothetical protein [Streptomyces beihaiensis]|uniref:Xylose isomerase n=1 Tax=Streptomyces beihaiensis TaxID=2984495 RepID=A0ABT3TXJ9_9ACTN|nr:hypothetical protein [Streptomyces beihaiensis]MCX3061773.1 hypothetical protein [Streptomyces beihaiensis]